MYIGEAIFVSHSSPTPISFVEIREQKPLKLINWNCCIEFTIAQCSRSESAGKIIEADDVLKQSLLLLIRKRVQQISN